MKHPWWHRFFLKVRSTPQLIPPSWVGNRIVMERNIQVWCKRCQKGYEISALDKYRPVKADGEHRDG